MINIKSRLESNANSVAADDVVSYIFILLPTFLMFLMTFMLGIEAMITYRFIMNDTVDNQRSFYF